MAITASATRVARRKRAAVLSLTTRFRLPHEGMTALTYLSRGSAFVLDSSAPTSMGTSASSPPLRVLTCQHVACPWLFPSYFADKWDWLQCVSEEYVRHSLELLAVDDDDDDDDVGDQQAKADATARCKPRVLAEFPLRPQVWLHPDRDVAMLALDADAATDALLAQCELQALVLSDSTATPGDHLLFAGHKQQPQQPPPRRLSAQASDDDHDDDDDDLGQTPKVVTGRFVGQSAQRQAFAWSEEVLEEGMCGGAVLDAATGHCVGLIEGIVPPFDAKAADAAVAAATAIDPEVSPSEQQRHAAAQAATLRMQKALADHVAFVPVSELRTFVEEPGELLLTGLGLDDDDGDWA